MTSLIALLLATVAAEPRVTGLSVAPVADRTEVVILVDGNVTPRHFMMDDGRLVIDLNGVSQAPRVDLRDFNRGGVRELRVAPFQPNVARVVLALGSPLQYEVVSEDGRIRVSFPNRSGEFAAWTQSLGTATAGGQAANAGPIGTPADQGALPEGRPVPDTRTQPAQQAAPPVAVQVAQQSAAPVPQPAPQPQLTAREIRLQQPMSVMFMNEPLIEVLGMFSERSGRNIIAAPGVQTRSITAELRNMPWDQALQAILAQNNLVMRELPSGVLVVDDGANQRARVETEPMVTQAFPIQYISADSIRGAILGLLTEGGRVTVNTASNSLLVTDVTSSLERVREILPQLDTRTPQVDISATIAFIDRTTLEAMGVMYDLKDSQGSQFNRLVQGFIPDPNTGVMTPTSEDVVLLGGNSIAALGNANYRVASPALELVTTLVLGRHSLITFLEALQQVSLSDIQAKPLVRTMDHRMASIQVGEETPIRVIDAGAGVGGAGGGAAPRATVEMKQTGVILEVTPHITGNQVLLDMRAERSNIAAAPSDIGVIFQTQNAQTQVLVNDGETVVIGGLTIVEKTRSRSGIPLLMDLPVIGALFRNELVRENKRDLLIMVTPHIVRER
ncbi:MAG TPA: secretin N-terminal domain-containing protein [Longimicrobiales bacterium]|nr:secretin N-terminal domain-containing protein [Longimicrobiales bacterium]